MGSVRTVIGSMQVKFEVRSFECTGLHQGSGVSHLRTDRHTQK